MAELWPFLRPQSSDDKYCILNSLGKKEKVSNQRSFQLAQHMAGLPENLKTKISIHLLSMVHFKEVIVTLSQILGFYTGWFTQWLMISRDKLEMSQQLVAESLRLIKEGALQIILIHFGSPGQIEAHSSHQLSNPKLAWLVVDKLNDSLIPTSSNSPSPIHCHPVTHHTWDEKASPRLDRWVSPPCTVSPPCRVSPPCHAAAKSCYYENPAAQRVRQRATNKQEPAFVWSVLW